MSNIPSTLGYWSTPCSRLRRLWPRGAGICWNASDWLQGSMWGPKGEQQSILSFFFWHHPQMVYGIGSPTLDQYWINFEFWNSSWIVNEKPWKAINNEKPGSKPITVVVFLRTFLASPGWLPGYRNYTTNRGPKGLEVQPIRTAWTEKSSSGDVQFMLCLRRLRRFNEIHMRFIWDSYEIHMRFIWESFMLHLYIYIYIQKRKNTRSAWKWTELPPRIWPRCNTMQHHATKIKAEFVEQKSDAGLVDRTASFMTRLAPWWVFAVAILRNFIIHKIFRTHIYIYIFQHVANMVTSSVWKLNNQHSFASCTAV